LGFLAKYSQKVGEKNAKRFFGVFSEISVKAHENKRIDGIFSGKLL